MTMLWSYLIIASLLVVGGSDVLDQILSDGVTNKVYTGVVAIAGTETSKYLYAKAFGYYDYIDEIPDTTPVSMDNIFDLASLSKVVATTSAVALLYQRGYLPLETKVADALGEPTYAHNGKSDITILNCLLHNAGYNPDPDPWYPETDFGCPNSFEYYPEEDFSCMDLVYLSLLNEATVTPPGEAFVYSDLSFITLQFVVGRTVYVNDLLTSSDLREECTQALNQSQATPSMTYNCYFEAFVRTNVFQVNSGWMNHSAYVLPSSLYSSALPTLNDTSYTHKRLQGQVSDKNCYAMGGVCGHSGVFSSAPDLSKLLTRLLVLASNDEKEEHRETGKGESDWLNSTTVKYFTREYNQSQSSRALGWTTNDPTVYDYGFTNSCGTMSTTTFMHTGYTGTIVCVDPVNKVWSVVLTNRVYNCVGSCPTGGSDDVKAIWKAINTELMTEFLAGKK